MARARHFSSFTEARINLRNIFDAAHAGLVTTVTRGAEEFVIVPAADLAHDLRDLQPSRAVVVAEGGGWSAVLPGAPVHGDADTFDAAIDDLIDALREYAKDWNDRLHIAPNHAQHRSLVRIVELSDDAQLREWLLDSRRFPSPVAGEFSPA